MRLSDFSRLLLILALLFAQMGGFAHAISHVVADQSQDQSLPHSCELCEAYTQIDTALGSPAVFFSTPEKKSDRFAVHFASICPNREFIAYSPRAPPYYA